MGGDGRGGEGRDRRSGERHESGRDGGSYTQLHVDVEWDVDFP